MEHAACLPVETGREGASVVVRVLKQGPGGETEALLVIPVRVEVEHGESVFVSFERPDGVRILNACARVVRGEATLEARLPWTGKSLEVPLVRTRG